MTIHLVPGLCSVTLRAHEPAQVVAAAAAAGLEVIEWGGDVHVPVGDEARAREVRARTEDAGLGVCSYGSYYGRVAASGDDAGSGDSAAGRDSAASGDFGAVLATAVALGAPRIRVWAGQQGSAQSTPSTRAGVVEQLRAAVDRAGSAGIEVATEYHPNTLTDTAASTRALLDEVGPGLTTYWQPPVGTPDGESLATLHAVLEHMVTVHVFSWWPGRERLSLEARADLWRQVCELVAADARRPTIPMLLEFVQDDEPSAVLRDASTLRDLIDAI